MGKETIKVKYPMTIPGSCPIPAKELSRQKGIKKHFNSTTIPLPENQIRIYCFSEFLGKGEACAKCPYSNGKITKPLEVNP